MYSNYLDPRVDGWPLMHSPYPTLILTASYLLIVYLGPKYMASREAYSLKTFIIVYNFMLVLLSIYMFHEVTLKTFKKYQVRCSIN